MILSQKTVTVQPGMEVKVTLADSGQSGFCVNMTRGEALLESHSFPPGCSGGVLASECYDKMLEGVDMASRALKEPK